MSKQKVNYHQEMEKEMKQIENLENKPKLLLQACCGPCSPYVLTELEKCFCVTVYFFNPNIHPKEEYDKRLAEQIRLVTEMGFDHTVVTDPYDAKPFYVAVKGMESLGEGSERCLKCFELRMRQTAIRAKEQGYDYFTTTLTVSPRKPSQPLNEIGLRLEEEVGVKFLTSDFKKNNGYAKSVAFAKAHDVYRQSYCGCSFSLAESKNRSASTMNIQEKYEQWLNQKTLDGHLKTQLQNMSDSEKEDAFYKDLEFGTAGMRGVMGPGTNRLNIYTIRKATVGFANYLLHHVKNAKERGVVIAYDNRHFSSEFALESAKVLATHGIKAYVFENLRPTPELSFAVRYLKAAGGIVITASHNPPEYNGYKIYDETGCQTLPEEGAKVIQYVNQMSDVFAIQVKEESELREAGLLETVGSQIDDAYLEQVKSLQIHPNLDKSNLNLVFSPLHGTATIPVKSILATCGYTNVHFVKEQTTPDPDFSHVTSPNPEEAAAYEMAIELGHQVEADILLTTDPDADRMGLGVRRAEGDYQLLTGNQTGALLLHYILEQRQATGTLPAKGRMFDTIVTSKLGASVAKKYDVTTTSTLTGFKFIGEQIRLMEETDDHFLFGYEESYGYLMGDFVRDKDAIQAILLCVEAAVYYKAQGKTLQDVLEELYQEHGYYQESLVNITLAGKEGSEKIQALLAGFREDPPTQIAGLNVVTISDYETKQETNLKDGGVTTLTLPTSNVLKYQLEDGSWFVVRPSGTEPKAKIYMSVVSSDKAITSTRIEQMKEELMIKVEEILGESLSTV